MQIIPLSKDDKITWTMVICKVRTGLGATTARDKKSTFAVHHSRGYSSSGYLLLDGTKAAVVRPTFPIHDWELGNPKQGNTPLVPKLWNLLALTLARAMQRVTLHACSPGSNLQPPRSKPCRTHLSADCGTYCYLRLICFIIILCFTYAVGYRQWVAHNSRADKNSTAGQFSPSFGGFGRTRP